MATHLVIFRPTNAGSDVPFLLLVAAYSGANVVGVRRLAAGAPSRTVLVMSPLRARVENGRLLLDEPTTLPDGTVLDLVAGDQGEDLTDEERRALHEALSTSSTSAEAGHLRPSSAILDELRHRR